MYRFGLALVLLLLSATSAFANPADDVIAIDSGSSTAVGGFQADMDFSGGASYTSAIPISVGNVTDPALPEVYASVRFASAFSYTVPGLNPGAVYKLRMHFAEVYWNAPGSRVFSIYINNGATPAIANFDVYAAAGGQGIALVREVEAQANDLGNIVISFTSQVDSAMISGLEISLATPIPPQPSPGFNLTIGADRALYTAGQQATIVFSLLNTPDNENYELFIKSSLNGNYLPLTRITDTQFYAITPALTAGQSQVIGSLFLQNKNEARALEQAASFYASEITRLTNELNSGTITDPNQIAAIEAEITKNQNRLDSTKDHLNQVRTPVGTPVSLNLVAE